VPTRQLDGLPPVRCLADDLDLGVASQELDQPGAHQAVVVRDQYARHP
jgi:hypothetical protein